MESQPAGRNRGPLGLETRECQLSFVHTNANNARKGTRYPYESSLPP